MSINRQDVEIRNQQHLMDAEALQYAEPTVIEIYEFLKNEGWAASNVDISFDNMMQLWSWTADIEAIK